MLCSWNLHKLHTKQNIFNAFSGNSFGYIRAETSLFQNVHIFILKCTSSPHIPIKQFRLITLPISSICSKDNVWTFNSTLSWQTTGNFTSIFTCTFYYFYKYLFVFIVFNLFICLVLFSKWHHQFVFLSTNDAKMMCE